ncbi:MAG: hypothetical protein ACREME_05375 [Gemmatimonadales bacterium]
MSDPRDLPTGDLLAVGAGLVRELQGMGPAVHLRPSVGGRAFVDNRLAALAAVTDELAARVPPPNPRAIVFSRDESRTYAWPRR